MRNCWNFLLALILALTSSPIEGANILFFLPTFSPSHLIIEMALAKEMAEHKHNVTVVATLPSKPDWLHPNLTYIQLNSIKLDMSMVIEAKRGSAFNKLRKIIELLKVANHLSMEIFNEGQMQELMNNRDKRFDLMVFGYLFGDFFLGLGEHFDCPIALVLPNRPTAVTMTLIGNPLLGISYTTLTTMNLLDDKLGFVFRLKNMIAVGIELLIWKVHDTFSKDLYNKHFPSDKYVSYEKAKERVAMVLFSHHFSEQPVRPLVPGLIEIGGIHLNDEPKPLPKDIEAFVSSAEHGVIFFSLGTNIKSNYLQPGTLDKIYNVLSKLPQKVLWKCDDESKVPGNATNILFRKWLPQADILGHPNVKLFFGHGGKGGITEAKFYGVPIVGLPVFGDQPMNMNEVVQKGYGLSIDHDESLTEEIIYKTVTEVLHNHTYADTVKKFANIYRDRPLKIKDNAVYWLEYLIRYKGAPHMQSPLKTMSFVEKVNLDVLAFIAVVFYVLVQIIKYVIKLAGRFMCRKKCIGKTKKD